MLALFSLVTLWAHDLVGRGQLGPRCAAWYPKRHLTFSDALGAGVFVGLSGTLFAYLHNRVDLSVTFGVLVLAMAVVAFGAAAVSLRIGAVRNEFAPQ